MRLCNCSALVAPNSEKFCAKNIQKPIFTKWNRFMKFANVYAQDLERPIVGQVGECRCDFVCNNGCDPMSAG